MSTWRNDAGEELTVPMHMLLDCTTLQDERRQWCVGGFAWVPCSERMPDENVTVLVLRYGATPELAQYELGDWWYIDKLPDGSGVVDGVTHWMPLPAPPKE